MAIRKVSVGRHLTAGTTETLYTVPDGYRASWNLLYMINNTASSKTFTVGWYNSSGTLQAHVFQSYPISSKTYVMFDSGAWINMDSGHYVTITTEAGADADAILSFELERNNT